MLFFRCWGTWTMFAICREPKPPRAISTNTSNRKWDARQMTLSISGTIPTCHIWQVLPSAEYYLSNYYKPEPNINDVNPITHWETWPIRQVSPPSYNYSFSYYAIMQNYPNNLRELRKAKGMLQIEVAQLLGHLNSDRISDWEKGYGMPSVTNLFKLATVYGVTAEDLYREIRVTAGREVEEKQVSLKNENEWARRMKLRECGIINPLAPPIHDSSATEGLTVDKTLTLSPLRSPIPTTSQLPPKQET